LSKSKTKPNMLLRSLIVLSVGIHMVIFMQIAGIYRSGALSYIELTLRDTSRPPTRGIPRPRPRPKNMVKPRDARPLKVAPRTIPRLKPVRLTGADKDLPNSLVESINPPDMEGLHAGLSVTRWQDGVGQEEEGDYLTAGDYFQMVRLRIEAHKRYPSIARVRQIEGRTTVRFLIAPDGRMTGLEVIGSARSGVLDRAALTAVREASPFPIPPTGIFKGPIALELCIVFELT
jgi:periplasmic protein TonB